MYTHRQEQIVCLRIMYQFYSDVVTKATLSWLIVPEGKQSIKGMKAWW